jgi:spore germination protein YaaH
MQRIKHFALISLSLLAAAVLLSQPVVASTHASSATHQEVHPLVMQDTARSVAAAPTGPLKPFTRLAPQAAVGGAGGPAREIFGFGLASSLADPTFGYPSWDFSLLSTVALFGLHVQSDGTFANDSGWSVWNSSQLTGLLSTAHSHGTRVLLTIILQDFSPGTPTMCAGLQHYQTTIPNAVNEMKAKGVDGLNVDYEGLNGSCGGPDSSWTRHALTNFIAGLRGAMPQGAYLSVDTYASSAIDSIGFFDLGGLSPSVDSFFVMAYDLEYSNYARAPTACSSFCLGPTAPLGGYYYNDTSTIQQYTSAVPAAKVILGVPYYGRKACVGSAAPNQYPTSGVVADTYLDASGEASSNLVQAGSYAAHRDAHDPSGQERWDTWVNTQLNCTRELYWDDTTSLSQKYDLVNRSNLRGVGIWNLNYGGGAPELWSTLNSYFSCQASITPLANPVSTTEWTLGMSAGSCAVASYDLQQFDSTTNQGWFNLGPFPPTGATTNVVVDGYPGHTYQFEARAHAANGIVGPWGPIAGTSVSGNATYSHPFKGLYTLDAYGGINPDDSPPLGTVAYWTGWKEACAAHARPGPNSPQVGLVMDCWGGLHSYGAPALSEPASSSAGHYWPGWNIARDFAFMPDGNEGLVLDGWGGLHPFYLGGSTATIVVHGNAYWPGWDIARKVVIFPDGSGGYVLDGWGGLHAFGINGGAPPVNDISLSAYWPGWMIARDVVLVPGNGMYSGYVLDGWGGLHPFHPTKDGSAMPPTISPSAYWRGWDIARGLYFLPGSSTAGYTLDGWGGVHPFGGAPAVNNHPYWPGSDIARCFSGF